MPQPFRLTLLLTFTLLGCRSSPTPTLAPANLKTYTVRGKVVSTDATHVTLDHQAIPGFMDAMVMPYILANPNVASELHPGDRIQATLTVHQDPDGQDHTDLDHILILAQARPDYVPAVQYHVPTPGDLVPNFALRNQNGQTLHLNQFHGKILLLTFIYTRCPLPDFCPRVTRNFAQIHQSLSTDPALNAKTRLLSISFDPAYDTPAVLRRYATQYLGPQAPAALPHWDFAVTTPSDLAAVTRFFNVGITPGSPGTLTHSLSTVLIDPQGKVAAWWPSNEWQPAEVLAKIKQIAATA